MVLALLITHHPKTGVEAIAKGMPVNLNNAPMDQKTLFSRVQHHAAQVTKHSNLEELVE